MFDRHGLRHHASLVCFPRCGVLLPARPRMTEEWAVLMIPGVGARLLRYRIHVEVNTWATGALSWSVGRDYVDIDLPWARTGFLTRRVLLPSVSGVQKVFRGNTRGRKGRIGSQTRCASSKRIRFTEAALRSTRHEPHMTHPSKVS